MAAAETAPQVTRDILEERYRCATRDVRQFPGEVGGWSDVNSERLEQYADAAEEIAAFVVQGVYYQNDDETSALAAFRRRMYTVLHDEVMAFAMKFEGIEEGVPS